MPKLPLTPPKRRALLSDLACSADHAAGDQRLDDFKRAFADEVAEFSVRIGRGQAHRLVDEPHAAGRGSPELAGGLDDDVDARTLEFRSRNQLHILHPAARIPDRFYAEQIEDFADVRSLGPDEFAAPEREADFLRILARSI